MDENELEDAIDEQILKSGLDLGTVAGLLSIMALRYQEQAGNEEIE